MKRVEYEFIYDRLNEPADVKKLHERMGISKDLLFNILGKKIVRNATKRYYIVKRKSGKLFHDWERGKSLRKIDRSINFPSMLTAFFVLNKKGISRKRFNNMVKDPVSIRNHRIRKEIGEVIREDFVYSPWAHKLQAKNGKETEDKIERWLEERGIKFMTENESRKRNRVRTPDFLLKKPITIRRKRVKWIESKASFGDDKEIKKDFKKQLKPYIDHFGPGAVVYWYGFLEGLRIDSEILILSHSFFDKKKGKSL